MPFDSKLYDSGSTELCSGTCFRASVDRWEGLLALEPTYRELAGEHSGITVTDANHRG